MWLLLLPPADKPRENKIQNTETKQQLNKAAATSSSPETVQTSQDQSLSKVRFTTDSGGKRTQK